MCGTRDCWSLYYLFPFFHLSDIFWVPFTCQAELGAWETKMNKTQPLPSSSSRSSRRDRLSRGSACVCREPVGGARLAREWWAASDLPGGLQRAVSTPLASHRLGLSFPYNRIIPCDSSQFFFYNPLFLLFKLLVIIISVIPHAQFAFRIHGFNRQRIKNIWKDIPEISKKKIFNLPRADDYSHSI